MSQHGALLREELPLERRFLDTPPFHHSRLLAERHGCDLAVPNGAGIGNVLAFTRLVDDYARSLGRRVRLLTAPLRPLVGQVPGEEDYPHWKHNPFISEIVNAEHVAPGAIELINREQDNMVTYSHVITNILHQYGLKPSALKPALHLSEQEQVWAIERLSGFPRPVVCVHAGGTSSPLRSSPWFAENWRRLIERMEGRASFIQIGRPDLDAKSLPVPLVPTSLRELMAVIWASDAFVGFDSSPAHIATAFDVPAIVLWEVLRKSPIEDPHQPGFGASALTRWSYPQNANFMLLGERDHEIVEVICDRLQATFDSRHYQRHPVWQV